jgi:hypothetical protein
VSEQNLRALSKSTGASILSIAALHNRSIMTRPDQVVGYCLRFSVQLNRPPEGIDPVVPSFLPPDAAPPGAEHRLALADDGDDENLRSFVSVHGKLVNQFKTWVLRGLSTPELHRMQDVVNVRVRIASVTGF